MNHPNLWAYSPAACLLLSVTAVAAGAVAALWATANYLSMGAVSAPWNKPEGR